MDILRGSVERRLQTTVGPRIKHVLLSCILALLTFIHCVRNKSAGSLDVGVGRDGRKCRSLKR